MCIRDRDECVGHMTEKVVIPPADQIDVEPRHFTDLPPEEYLPYKADDNSVPDMVKAGDGYRIHITGLTHDERGYPVISADCQDRLVRRLVGKIHGNVDSITRVEQDQVEQADVVVVSYGITARVALRPIELARRNGIKVGHLRLVTVWPFPEQMIRELSGRIKGFVVPELNLGQVVLEVERCAAGQCPTLLVDHAGGTVHDPDRIYQAIVEAAK